MVFIDVIHVNINRYRQFIRQNHRQDGGIMRLNERP